MSDSSKYTLFPELSGLRRTIFELKDTKTETKPKLAELVDQLNLPSRLDTVDELTSNSKSPLTQSLPKEYEEKAEPIRAAIQSIEADLVDEVQRVEIASGNYDERLIQQLQPHLYLLLEELEGLNLELKGLPYGTRSIERQHLYDSYVALFNIALNTFFDTLELRPLFLESGSRLDGFMDALGGRIDQISGQTGLDSLWDLMASWIRTWSEKDFYRDKLAFWIRMAELEVEAPRNVEGYEDGDELVRIEMLNGEFASLEVEEGRLPVGIGISETGAVAVEEADKLFAGSFRGIVLRVENNRGFVNLLPLEGLEFRPDQAASYTVIPRLFIPDLENGSLLAYPIDLDGAIAGAQLLGGNFPPGVEFDTRQGHFKVADTSRLVPASYQLEVVTFDEFGGETEHKLTLTLIAGKEREAVFVSESPFKISELSPLQVVGKIEVENGIVAGAAPIQGKVPPGCSLTSLGVLVVEDPTVLKPGKYGFPASVTTANKQVLSCNVLIQFQ